MKNKGKKRFFVGDRDVEIANDKKSVDESRRFGLGNKLIGRTTIDHRTFENLQRRRAAPNKFIVEVVFKFFSYFKRLCSRFFQGKFKGEGLTGFFGRPLGR